MMMMLSFWILTQGRLVGANVSEKSTDSIFRAEGKTQYVSPKHWHPPMSLHEAKTRKESIIKFLFHFINHNERKYGTRA
jgi:hypothetical protein